MYHFNHILFNCFFVMTPKENYTIYLSIAFDLVPWNPLIHKTSCNNAKSTTKSSNIPFSTLDRSFWRHLFTRVSSDQRLEIVKVVSVWRIRCFNCVLILF